MGESYSSSLEAEQLVQAVTGPRYPSAVQCSTVQYSTVQYSTTHSTVQCVAGAPQSGGSGRRISQI